MNIRDLQYLSALAEEGHFGRAAEACHVSQPALSGQIRKLEDLLGVTLFERTKRSVQITDVGEQVLGVAREIIRLADEIHGIAAAQSDPLKGSLNLGMIHTIGPYLTPIFLPAVKYHLPKLALELNEDITQNLESRLLSGDIDVGITATPAKSDKLSEIILYEEPFWFALPQNTGLHYADEVSLDDVKDQDFLMLADGHCLRDQILAFYETKNSQSGDFSTQKTSLTTILSLVGTGAGITMVPAMSLSGSWITDSGIVVRREASGEASRLVRLVFRKTFPRRPLLEKLADIIGAVVPDTVTPMRR